MEELNYKKVLKDRLGLLSKRSKNPITLKKVAEHLDIQYTYLSRVLNTEDEHLKEDYLYEALHYLEFQPSEIDYLMQLRILVASHSEARRELARSKIAKLRSQTLKSVEQVSLAEQKMLADSDYLLDPYAVLFFVSFSIERYRKDPFLFGQSLGLSRQKVKVTLEKIEKAGLIKINEGVIKIINTNRIHYQADHFLTRLHQQQLKMLSIQKLQTLSENEKKSFMVTFTGDSEAKSKILEKFNVFIGQVEQIATKAKQTNLYQLNFDLFDWV